MTSSNGYIERMELELNQLNRRIEKLENFLTLVPDSFDSAEYELLNRQLAAMREYRDVLTIRYDKAIK